MFSLVLCLMVRVFTQPGVEAGKKAAAVVLDLQGKLIAALTTSPQTAEQLAKSAGAADQVETAFLTLEHLAANGRAKSDGAADPGARTFVKA